MTIKKMSYLASIAFTAAIGSQAAYATEGGGSTYPMGAESQLVGALPPPGLYTLLYANRYSADALKDNNGNTVPVNFKVTANALVPRLIWVTDNKFLGGQVAHAILVPLVNLDVNVNGTGQSKTGIGDIDITALALGYHHSNNLHSVLGLDFFVPTGGYNKNELANIGRNYWTIQPVYAVSYIDPAGWNMDVKLMLDFNLKNKDTNYTSGRELHFDYTIGYGFANNWVAGVGGYAYKQITSDQQNGRNVADNKGQAFAIGPSIKYDNAKGFFITAKYQKEMNVRSRPEGNAFWVKASIPF